VGLGLKRAFAAAKATRVKPESPLPITKLGAGRYRVREGELQFDINKLRTGWDLVGHGDAAYKLLLLRGVQGYFVTLTSAQRRLGSILLHPATQLLQKTLRVPEGDPGARSPRCAGRGRYFEALPLLDVHQLRKARGSTLKPRVQD
jgi:hypothetical protein